MMLGDVPEGVTPFDKLNFGSDDLLDTDFDVITEPDNREDVPDAGDYGEEPSDLLSYGGAVVKAASVALGIVDSIVKATGNQTAISAVEALRNSNKFAGASLELISSFQKKGFLDDYQDVPVDVPTDKSETDPVMAQLKRLSRD